MPAAMPLRPQSNSFTASPIRNLTDMGTSDSSNTQHASTGMAAALGSYMQACINHTTDYSGTTRPQDGKTRWQHAEERRSERRPYSCPMCKQFFRYPQQLRYVVRMAIFIDCNYPLITLSRRHTDSRHRGEEWIGAEGLPKRSRKIKEAAA